MNDFFFLYIIVPAKCSGPNLCLHTFRNGELTPSILSGILQQLFPHIDIKYDYLQLSFIGSIVTLEDMLI